MRWFALILLVIFSLMVLGAPVLILHPFKEETMRGLTIAYALKRWGLLIDLAIIAAAIAIARVVWHGRWWRKVAVSLALIVIVAASALARFNHFEKMFRPLPNPHYAQVAETSFVDADDMIMTVARGDDVAAYPIRQLAYHHIVQDVVGGLPVVVTY